MVSYRLYEGEWDGPFAFGIIFPSILRKNNSGQKFEPSSVYNLGQFDDLWKTDIYDLRSWYDGHCHTFLPTETQKRSLGSKMSLFLGHRSIFDNYEGPMLKQFNVVIILRCDTISSKVLSVTQSLSEWKVLKISQNTFKVNFSFKSIP